MPNVRTVVRAISRRAKLARITLSSKRLRDFIAIALWRCTYSAAKEAESAGLLTIEDLVVPIFLGDACSIFRLERDVVHVLFGQSYFGPSASRDPANDGIHFDLQRLSASRVPLHIRQDKQHRPLEAFVTLTHEGRVGVGVGNEQQAISQERDFLDNRTIRWHVSAMIDGSALALFLQREGRPLLAAVHRGHQSATIEPLQNWLLTEDAARARYEIAMALEQVQKHDVRWPSEYFFGADGEPPTWGDGQSIRDRAIDVWRRARSRGVHLLLGERVEDCLLEAALKVLHAEPATLSRAEVRDIYCWGGIKLHEYADWIASHSNGDNAEEAEKDREMEAYLAFNGAGAGGDECRAGVAAAETLLESLGVSVAQAFVAMTLNGKGIRCIKAHLHAWQAAEQEAFKIAYGARIEQSERVALIAE